MPVKKVMGTWVVQNLNSSFFKLNIFTNFDYLSFGAEFRFVISQGGDSHHSEQNEVSTNVVGKTEEQVESLSVDNSHTISMLFTTLIFSLTRPSSL